MENKVYDDIFKVAQRRRTTKKYNPSMDISDENMTKVFEMINTAPHSMGLEFWRVIDIRRSAVDVKSEIENLFMFNKEKVQQASNLLIFVTKKGESINKSNEDIVDTARRNSKFVQTVIGHEWTEDNTFETLDRAINFVDGQYKDKTEWAIRQTYIAAGYAVLAAESLEIKSTIMEGFEQTLTEHLYNANIINDDETVAIAVAMGYSDGVEHSTIGKNQLRYPIDHNFKVVK